MIFPPDDPNNPWDQISRLSREIDHLRVALKKIADDGPFGDEWDAGSGIMPWQECARRALAYDTETIRQAEIEDRERDELARLKDKFKPSSNAG